MQAALLFLLISFLIILGILISMLYVVRQQSVAIVERFGRYQKIATSGIHMRLPFGIDKIAARIQLRLLQSEIVVETKTKDNVFVMMNVATQYRVNEQNVTDAYYKLMRPEAQIKSYIEDALRSSVPKLTLDELFEKKDEIALEVQHQVAEEMTTYGYIIVKTLKKIVFTGSVLPNNVRLSLMDWLNQSQNLKRPMWVCLKSRLCLFS